MRAGRAAIVISAFQRCIHVRGYRARPMGRLDRLTKLLSTVLLPIVVSHCLFFNLKFKVSVQRWPVPFWGFLLSVLLSWASLFFVHRVDDGDW